MFTATADVLPDFKKLVVKHVSTHLLLQRCVVSLHCSVFPMVLIERCKYLCGGPVYPSVKRGIANFLIKTNERVKWGIAKSNIQQPVGFDPLPGSFAQMETNQTLEEQPQLMFKVQSSCGCQLNVPAFG